MKAVQKLEKHFEHWHFNPPPPFNPEFNPLAKPMWDRAMQLSLAEENETWTREQRAKNRRTIYDNLMRAK